MDNEQNKSEKATPHKLKEAREKGQISKSTEFNALFSLIVFFTVAHVFWQDVMLKFQLLAKKTLFSANHLSTEPEILLNFISNVFLQGFFIILPFLMVLIVIALISNIFQIGFIFTAFPLKPDFTKLNPAKSIKKIFSKKTLFELFKSCLKVSFFTAFLYLSSDYLKINLLPLFLTSPEHLSAAWSDIFFQLVLWVLLILFPIVFLDYIYNKWDFMKQMMMSKREVKDEHKKRDGDPEIKNKQKEIQKELLEKTASLSHVKEANVIITNPTHIAVALAYKPNNMIAPLVLAMGKGDFAAKIRKLAHQHNVPIMQNKSVARLLYKECELNRHLPLQCYEAVAPIFRSIYAMESEKSTNG